MTRALKQPSALQSKFIRNSGRDYSNPHTTNVSVTKLNLRMIKFQREVPLSVSYKGVKLDCGYRVDLIVDDQVVVELKATEKILPVHHAQLLS